jgi:hypothetical protein
MIAQAQRQPIPATAGATSGSAVRPPAAATANHPPEPAAAGKRRLPAWRTLLGWGLAVLVVVLVARQWLAVDWVETWARLQSTNLFLFALSLAVFGLTYPVRAWRWGVLLANAGIDRGQVPRLSELTAIVYRAAFVNCVGVARVGDLFRATLLNRRAGISTGSALGTVAGERLLDLATLAAIVAVAAPFALPAAVAGDVALFSLLGLGGVLLAVAALWLAARFRGTVEKAIPVRFRPAFARVLAGAAAAARRTPLLVGASAVGWALEGSAVFLIAVALGVPLSFGAAVVVGLVAALLAAIPITPSGLGFAEAGLAVLLIALGLEAGTAAAVVLLVRLVSYWSIVLVGGLAALRRRAL